MRGFLLKASVGLILAVAAALPARSQGEDASSEKSETSLEQRYDALFQKMLNNPDDLDTMFEFAKVATRLQRYEPAISTLERMLVYNQNLPRVRLELGVLYYRMGSYEVAESYFQRVKQREDVPPSVASRVDQYLGRIQDKQARNQFAGSFFLGVRYDSNANAGPEDDDVQFVNPFNGRVIEAELTQGQAEKDFSLVTTGFLRHTYDLQTRFDESWETTLLGYSTRHQDFPRLDVDFFELTTGPRLSFLPESLGDTSIRPYLLGNLVRLDRDLLARTFGGGAEFAAPFGPHLYGRANYELRYRDFEDVGASPNASDRTGYTQELDVALNYGLTSNLTATGRIGVAHREAQEDFESYVEGFSEVGGRVRYSAPGDLTKWPWVADASVRVTQTEYQEPDPTIALTQERSDTEVQLSASNTFRVNKAFAVELRLHHTIKQSNIPNFEFDNTSVTLGGRVRF